MSPSAWSAMVPFDPDDGVLPPALEALYARPAATVPVVLLVADAAARKGGWAARAAIALASAWAARRGDGIVLADLNAATPELHEALGESNTEGLADVFEFGVSLGRVARAAAGRDFQFLPPGPYVPDPESMLATPGWEALVSQFAAEQATMLAYVPANAPGLAALARRAGKAILLSGTGDAAGLAAALPDGCTIVAALSPTGTGARAAAPDAAPAEPDEAEAEFTAPPFDPVPGRAPAPGEELDEPTFVVRERKRRLRTAPLLWTALLLALAAGGWYAAPVVAPVAAPYVTRAYDAVWPTLESLWPWGRDSAPAEAPAAAGSSAADSAATAAAPAPAPPAEARPIEEPLPFSVAIEAHLDYAVARERIVSLRGSEPRLTYYLAPVLVDSVVYYRLMAGPAADTASAREVMRTLVRRGHKTEMDDWAIRPTIWAYRMGEFPTRREAEAAVEGLARQEVPAYVTEIPYTEGPPRYRVYAGAYEGRNQADDVMARLLERAGVSAPLVRRTGRPVR